MHLFNRCSRVDRLEFKEGIEQSKTEIRIMKETLGTFSITELAFTDLPGFNLDIV